MKNKITLILTLLTVVFIQAQAPSIQWQKSLGGTGIDKANSIIQTNDGGFIVAGYTASNDGDVIGNHGGNDCWILKLSSLGTILWKKTLGGTGNEGISSIQQTSDGGYIAVASCASSDGDITISNGGSDIWVLKLNENGNIIWQKSLGGTSSESGYSIKKTTDGGFIIAGSTSSFNGDVTGNHGGGDSWVIKLDSVGTIVWQKALGGNDLDFSDDIEQTADGGYIIAASSYSNNGDATVNKGLSDYWIVKLNSSGTIIWQKSYGGSGSERAYSVKQTLDGGYVIAGSSTSTDGDIIGNHGSNDAWIIKLNAIGNLVWQISLGGSGVDSARNIYQTSDGSFIVSAYSDSTDGNLTGNLGSKDVWIAKLSSSGTIIWQKTYGGTSSDEAFDIKLTSDGYQVFAGNSSSNDLDVNGNHGNADFWVVKLGPSNLSNNSFSFNNINIFPNPVNDNNLTVKLDYFINSQEITITDIAGKKIHQQKLEGLTTKLNLSKLVKGIYFLNLVNGSKTITKKFIKI
jgi:hypothetical protein